MELHEAPAVYEKIIHYNEDKELQVRLTINTFRGIEYLHVRKYYLDFTEEWKPSPEGVAMELDFNNSRELFSGLLEILSLAESKEIIEEHFKDRSNRLMNVNGYDYDESQYASVTKGEKRVQQANDVPLFTEEEILRVRRRLAKHEKVRNK